MATDLDQKLLPDVITLPLIVAALVLTLTGFNPLLADKELPIASALLAGIGAPLLLFALDVVVKGALGMGDLKLVAGLGLMSGVTRLFGGLVVASIASAVILIVLIAGRRLTMKTAIPFGPILILGGMLAARSERRPERGPGTAVRLGPGPASQAADRTIGPGADSPGGGIMPASRSRPGAG